MRAAAAAAAARAAAASTSVFSMSTSSFGPKLFSAAAAGYLMDVLNAMAKKD